MKAFKIYYGKIGSEKIIDEIIIAKYISPKSYTGENLLEISCHGSPCNY